MNRNGSGQTLFVEGASSPAWSPAPIPVLTGINPNSANAGGADSTLTISGSNFVDGSVVRWNGSACTTTYVNDTRLSAGIPAADIATVGPANVTVFTLAPGGGVSNAAAFGSVDRSYT
jgi:hypothetical protein